VKPVGKKVACFGLGSAKISKKAYKTGDPAGSGEISEREDPVAKKREK
jgi:hypothetical protein